MKAPKMTECINKMKKRRGKYFRDKKLKCFQNIKYRPSHKHFLLLLAFKPKLNVGFLRVLDWIGVERRQRAVRDADVYFA